MDPGIAGILGAILGVLIGGWVGYYFSVKLMRRQEFNKAAAAFRSAFIKEQRLLSFDSLADSVGLTASDIVKAAIDRHEVAMIIFKPFISKCVIKAYEKAWEDYAGDSRHFEQYSTDNKIMRPKKKELALQRINRLLEFADYNY